MDADGAVEVVEGDVLVGGAHVVRDRAVDAVSYTHLRAHETVLDLVCRLLLEKKKDKRTNDYILPVTPSAKVVYY